MRDCFFAHLSHRPCDGPEDFAHLIPKQTLKRELRTNDKDVIWAPEVWVRACRRHHGDFDARLLRLPRASLPRCTELWADERGLGWLLDRMYGSRTEETTSSKSSSSVSSGRS
jgi:hypothetical protein